jgi:hypothetical protein
MADKKAFVLRMSPEALKELEIWAESEFRSLNGQIEYLLQQALREHRRSKQRKRNTDDNRNAEG